MHEGFRAYGVSTDFCRIFRGKFCLHRCAQQSGLHLKTCARHKTEDSDMLLRMPARNPISTVTLQLPARNDKSKPRFSIAAVWSHAAGKRPFPRILVQALQFVHVLEQLLVLMGSFE